ncbi:MAG: recombination protein RecR, partial [Halioglobus sp.]
VKLLITYKGMVNFSFIAIDFISTEFLGKWILTPMNYPSHLSKLIEVLKRLPGVGRKSAERFAFQMISWSDEEIAETAKIIGETKQQLKSCEQCGCLMDTILCFFCKENRAEMQSICVVASAREVFAIEETREYHGLYHVLGGVLSPLDGREPDHLSIGQLKKRLGTLDIKEVIIALDSTLEGDATSLFLKRELKSFPVSISRLAFGLPMGSALEFVDGGTLARALEGRLQV